MKRRTRFRFFLRGLRREPSVTLRKLWLGTTYKLELWYRNHALPCPDDTFPWVHFGREYDVPQHWIKRHLSWLAEQPVDMWQAGYSKTMPRDDVHFRIPYMWPKGHVPFTNHEGYGRPLPPNGVLGYQGELASGKVA